MATPNIQSYWENEIRPALDPIQKEMNGLTYYVFQTLYRFRPDLLLVGINPGGDFNDGNAFLDRPTNWYTQCKKNPEECCDFNETVCRIFGYGTNDALFQLLENAVGMNKVYFNTGSEEKLNRIALVKQIESLCQGFTRTLIEEYIQPKQIVAMGEHVFNSLKNKPMEFIKHKDVVIKKSHRNDIPVYYIPNPSRLNQNTYYNKNKAEQFTELLAKHLV
jgi:hypothetical protein